MPPCAIRLEGWELGARLDEDAGPVERLLEEQGVGVLDAVECAQFEIDPVVVVLEKHVEQHGILMHLAEERARLEVSPVAPIRRRM
jgi:hypothetical protein